MKDCSPDRSREPASRPGPACGEGIAHGRARSCLHLLCPGRRRDLTNPYERENFLRLLHNPERLPRVKFMAPALPADFINRPQEFDKLKGLLLYPERGDPVAITTALQGAGGFGKTTLATALCHDEDVKLAFGDGILWVTLGEKPDLVALLNDLCTSLTDSNPKFSEVGTAANRLAELLEDRDCLVVLDDVWDQGHLEPFLRGGKTCTGWSRRGGARS